MQFDVEPGYGFGGVFVRLDGVGRRWCQSVVVVDGDQHDLAVRSGDGKSIDAVGKELVFGYVFDGR